MTKSTVSDIEVAPGLQVPDALSHLPRGHDKQSLAEKLRGKGWSYRRIAETLQVKYGMVSRWLSGPVEPPPPEAMPRYVPQRPAAARGASPSVTHAVTYSDLEQRHFELIDRCDRLLAAFETERAEAKQREAKLLGIIERLETLVMDVSRRNGM